MREWGAEGVPIAGGQALADSARGVGRVHRTYVIATEPQAGATTQGFSVYFCGLFQDLGNMKRNPFPAKLDHAGMIGWLDTRELPIEQHPWTPHLPFTLERHTLPFGDFTLPGPLSKRLIFERKAKNDYIACVGRERDRFSKVIQAMRGYEWPFLIIEASWLDLETANWPGEITSSQAIGTLHGWQADGINVVLAENAERAAKIVARLSFTIVRRVYESAREIIGACFAQEQAA
jgi:hypothetical protein